MQTNIYDPAGLLQQTIFKLSSIANGISGFQNTGIYPWNPNIFSSKFLASALSQESSKELSATEKPNTDQQQGTCEALSSILGVLSAFVRQSWRASPHWHLSVAVASGLTLFVTRESQRHSTVGTKRLRMQGRRRTKWKKSFENRLNVWGKLRRKAEFLSKETEP